MKKLFLFFIVSFYCVIYCLLAYCQQAYSETPKNELTKSSRAKYTKPQGRDPFLLPLTLKKKLKSSGQEQASLPDLKLYGIVLGEDGREPKALINDDVLSIGDSIGPAIVVEIRKDSVKLEFDGEERILTIEK